MIFNRSKKVNKKFNVSIKIKTNLKILYLLNLIISSIKIKEKIIIVGRRKSKCLNPLYYISVTSRMGVIKRILRLKTCKEMKIFRLSF